MPFSEFVKEVRHCLNLNQQQLAQALNVSYTTINRWENNHVIPSNLAQKSFFDLCENNFISIPDELRNNSVKQVK
jgi:DNA-binding transcriptional regulator YiaG